MLKIEIDMNEGKAKVEAEGGSIDMGVEILFVIADIYKTMRRRSEGAAEAFKMLIRAAVEDEDGPVWNGSLGGEGIEICFEVPRKEGS